MTLAEFLQHTSPSYFISIHSYEINPMSGDDYDHLLFQGQASTIKEKSNFLLNRTIKSVAPRGIFEIWKDDAIERVIDEPSFFITLV